MPFDVRRAVRVQLPNADPAAGMSLYQFLAWVIDIRTALGTDRCQVTGDACMRHVLQIELLSLLGIELRTISPTSF